MWGWLCGNWDKLLSVVSFGQSLYAQREAGSARQKVERVIDRESLLRSISRAEQCLFVCRDLQDCRSSVWPRGRCDQLREELTWLRESPHLSEDVDQRVTAGITELRRPIKNTVQAKAWIRRLVETLIAVRAQLERQMKEMEL